MIIDKMIDIVKFSGNYRSTRNIFKKVYYKHLISKNKKEIYKSIDNASHLYDILLEFAEAFYNIQDIYTTNYRYKICSDEENKERYSVYIYTSDEEWNARLDPANKSIEINCIPKDITRFRFFGVLQYDNDIIESNVGVQTKISFIMTLIVFMHEIINAFTNSLMEGDKNESN